MGQIQANAGNISNNSINAPTFMEAQISFSNDAVIRPNGFFPPEIIVFILKYTDFADYVRLSGACKLWYEIIKEELKNMYISRYGTLESLEDNWKANFYRRTFCDKNLAKGKLRAEAIAYRYYPNPITNEDCSTYVTSFEGNKVIFNNRTMENTLDEGSSASLESQFLLDLDTMKREPIPYGTIFANGFKIRTLIRNVNSFFDWREFEVDDGTTKRIIERTVPKIPNYDWGFGYHKIFVNQDGSPTVLTADESPSYYNADLERYIRQVDLRTGEITHEFILKTRSIIAFIGDIIVYSFEHDIYVMNIQTKEQKRWNSLDGIFYYCKDMNMIGQGTKDGEVILYDWPSLEIVSKIKVNSGMLDPPDVDMFIGTEFIIGAIAFDKSKLVVAMGVETRFYAVFDMKTKTLIQTFYNLTEDRRDIKGIYLAPNGSIITDCGNLILYDFASPKSIPVIFAEHTSQDVVRMSVPAQSLSTFLTWKFNVYLEKVHYSVLFATTKNGKHYRVTVFRPLNKDEEGSGTNWQQLMEYMKRWTAQKTQHTIQITRSNYSYPGSVYNEFVVDWSTVQKVMLVYELFNEATNEWEFTEPIELEELAEKKDEE